MASSTLRLLIGLSVLLLLAMAAQARPGRLFHPCKTLIFFSTSSYPLDQNPNLSLDDDSSSSGRSITFFITEIRRLNPRPVSIPSIYPYHISRLRAEIEEETIPSIHGSRSLDIEAAFRDFTEGILTVFRSLLFGVGCGVLTASIMYLIWSLFTPTRFDYQDSDDESDSDEDVYASDPKKMGYIAIPAAGAVPVSKEVVV
ncbi:uncharacterized protein LOC124925100 [Impatiens glandulifera]|uniref:uncharacterized protein LOC124925100 n=1 Tax=Impatiens glandulifera TaxID=253017 RepID=UPI001FB0A2B7|nr:uncharacterized protein LOC124925100 [Impatiens glandulifera]